MSQLAVVEPMKGRGLARIEAERIEEAARKYRKAARAANTRRAYQTDLEHFRAWCELYGESYLPASPSTLAAYLTAIAPEYKFATLSRRLSAISQAHQSLGADNPARAYGVRLVLAGIKREKGTRPAKRAALLADQVRAMLASLPDGIIGMRDRAILLLGFAIGLRRSELVALDLADLTLTDDGLIVHLRRSKTDQAGEGRDIPVRFGTGVTCPVKALQAWLQAANIEAGPIFRPVDRHGNVGQGRLTDGSVARLVKRAALAAGFDPEAFAGHSLRAGCITQAAKAGCSEADIARTSGHRSVAVLRGYVQAANIFDGAVSGRLGL